ncbi:MAG: hypothetical protein ACFCD0_06075 [Gemmataceae bacterium]
MIRPYRFNRSGLALVQLLGSTAFLTTIMACWMSGLQLCGVLLKTAKSQSSVLESFVPLDILDKEKKPNAEEEPKKPVSLKAEKTTVIKKRNDAAFAAPVSTTGKSLVRCIRETGGLEIMDVESGRTVFGLLLPGFRKALPSCVRFSPDSRYLVITSWTTKRQYLVDSKRLKRGPQQFAVNMVKDGAFSSDSKHVYLLRGDPFKKKWAVYKWALVGQGIGAAQIVAQGTGQAKRLCVVSEEEICVVGNKGIYSVVKGVGRKIDVEIHARRGAISPDAKFVALHDKSNPKKVSLYVRKPDKLLLKWTNKIKENYVEKQFFSRDGEFLITLARIQKINNQKPGDFRVVVHVYSVKDGTEVFQTSIDNLRLEGVEFLTSKNLLFVLTKEICQVWQLQPVMEEEVDE